MRRRTRPILDRIDRMIDRLERSPTGEVAAALRVEFDTLRRAIVDYDAKRTREDYFFHKDLAYSREDHASQMGISTRELTNIERELKIPKRRPGNKKRGEPGEYRKYRPKRAAK